MEESKKKAEETRKRLNAAGLHNNEQIIGFYKGLYGHTPGIYQKIDHILDGTDPEPSSELLNRLKDMADKAERQPVPLYEG